MKPGGVVLVVGRTLRTARSLRDARPELAGALLASLLSARSLLGVRAREVYIEQGLDGLSPAMTDHLRGLVCLLDRELRRTQAPRAFHLLPVDGGPAEEVDAVAYCDRFRVTS